MTSSVASAGHGRRPLKVPSLAGSLGLLALLLVVGAVVARANPGLLSVLWTCSIKDLTGLPCLTCGLTRVLLHFAAGEVKEAFLLAPLPALFLVLSLLAGAWHVLARVRRTTLPDVVVGRWLAKRAVRWSALAAVLSLWAYAIVRSLQTGAP